MIKNVTKGKLIAGDVVVTKDGGRFRAEYTYMHVQNEFKQNRNKFTDNKSISFIEWLLQGPRTAISHVEREADWMGRALDAEQELEILRDKLNEIVKVAQGETK